MQPVARVNHLELTSHGVNGDGIDGILQGELGSFRYCPIVEGTNEVEVAVFDRLLIRRTRNKRQHHSLANLTDLQNGVQINGRLREVVAGYNQRISLTDCQLVAVAHGTIVRFTPVASGHHLEFAAEGVDGDSKQRISIGELRSGSYIPTVELAYQVVVLLGLRNNSVRIKGIYTGTIDDKRIDKMVYSIVDEGNAIHSLRYKVTIRDDEVIDSIPGIRFRIVTGRGDIDTYATKHIGITPEGNDGIITHTYYFFHLTPSPLTTIPVVLDVVVLGLRLRSNGILNQCTLYEVNREDVVGVGQSQYDVGVGAVYPQVLRVGGSHLVLTAEQQYIAAGVCTVVAVIPVMGTRYLEVAIQAIQRQGVDRVSVGELGSGLEVPTVHRTDEVVVRIFYRSHIRCTGYEGNGRTILRYNEVEDSVQDSALYVEVVAVGYAINVRYQSLGLTQGEGSVILTGHAVVAFPCLTRYKNLHRAKERVNGNGINGVLTRELNSGILIPAVETAYEVVVGLSGLRLGFYLGYLVPGCIPLAFVEVRRCGIHIQVSGLTAFAVVEDDMRVVGREGVRIDGSIAEDQAGRSHRLAGPCHVIGAFIRPYIGIQRSPTFGHKGINRDFVHNGRNNSRILRLFATATGVILNNGNRSHLVYIGQLQGDIRQSSVDNNIGVCPSCHFIGHTRGNVLG